MDSDALIATTGAGGTVTVNGKTLTVRQLTLIDMGQLRAWIKQKLPRPMDTFIEEMKSLQPLKELDQAAYEECRRELLLKAHEDERMQKAGGTPGYAMEVSSGDDTVAYMLWLSVRRDHPTETYETIKDALANEKIDEIKEKLDRINLSWMPKTAKKQQEQRDKNSPLMNQPLPTPA